MADNAQYGDVKVPTVLPFAEDIGPNTEYFYYGCQWWGGVNPEAAVWWKDHTGKCHFRCVLTGDSFEPLPRVQVANRQIDCSAFKDLIDRLVKIGILSMQSQREMLAHGKCDAIVSIRTATGVHHTYTIRGAWPNDERHREIAQIVMKVAPEFFPRLQRSGP